MGIDIADYMNDGSAGIAIGNFTGEPTSLFKTIGTSIFLEIGDAAGISKPTFPVLTFGLLFADMDMDGWQDLLMANGHIEPYIREVEANTNYPQPMTLLGNRGNGKFEDWSRQAGTALQQPIVGRGLAVGDLDDDGDLDIVVTTNAGPIRILRNDTEPHNYVRVLLKGLPPNTDAIGAKLTLISNELVQRRIVRTGSSYLSQSEFTQTFGLGEHQSIEQLIVTWPNGRKNEYKLSEINSTYVIVEGTSQPKLLNF